MMATSWSALVQPRPGGGREVHVQARMLGQPALHGRMLVHGIAVGDQMQRLVPGRFVIDLAQEPQPLYVDGVLRTGR
jgi:hypothetical protein